MVVRVAGKAIGWEAEMAGSTVGGERKGMKSWANAFQTRFSNPVVRALLGSRFHRKASETIMDLGYTGRKSGLRRRLPVMYARQGEGLVVVAGWPEVKRWWRNFGPTPQRVSVLLQGRRLEGDAVRLAAGTGAHAAALSTYRSRYPKMDLADDVPVLSITGLVSADGFRP